MKLSIAVRRRGRPTARKTRSKTMKKLNDAHWTALVLTAALIENMDKAADTALGKTNTANSV